MSLNSMFIRMYLAIYLYIYTLDFFVYNFFIHNSHWNVLEALVGFFEMLRGSEVFLKIKSTSAREFENGVCEF